jgi:hypothetical protein
MGRFGAWLALSAVDSYGLKIAIRYGVKQQSVNLKASRVGHIAKGT